MTKNLNESVREFEKKKKEVAGKQIEDIHDSIVNKGNPDIQLDFFSSYFEDKIRTYIETGVDPINKENPNRSIMKEWMLISSTPFSPVDIVVGEGIEKKHLITAPSLAPSSNLNVDSKTRGEINNIGEKYQHLANGLTIRAESALNSTIHTINDNLVLDDEKCRENWKNFFKEYDKLMGKEAKEEKEDKSKEEKHDLDVYEF